MGEKNNETLPSTQYQGNRFRLPASYLLVLAGMSCTPSGSETIYRLSEPVPRGHALPTPLHTKVRH